VEQLGQLAGLITRRSQVQILPPLPRAMHRNRPPEVPKPPTGEIREGVSALRGSIDASRTDWSPAVNAKSRPEGRLRRERAG